MGLTVLSALLLKRSYSGVILLLMAICTEQQSHNGAWRHLVQNFIIGALSPDTILFNIVNKSKRSARLKESLYVAWSVQPLPKLTAAVTLEEAPRTLCHLIKESDHCLI